MATSTGSASSPLIIPKLPNHHCSAISGYLHLFSHLGIIIYQLCYIHYLAFPVKTNGDPH